MTPSSAVRPSVVLHAGAHKTGTSLIQKYFRDRPAVIEALNGYFVGRSRTNRLIGWGEIVEERPGLLRDAVREAAEHRMVLLSHENSLGRPFVGDRSRLYPDAPRFAAALARSLKNENVHVIFHIRGQESFVESYYLQRVHEGYYGTFDEWLLGVDLDNISWCPTVNGLVDAFGPDRVTVIDFDTIKAGQEQFITDFLDVIAPGHGVDVQYGSRRNPSISAEGLEIALKVNPLLESADERRAMRKFLQKEFNNLHGDRPVLFTAEQKDELRERYCVENATLLRTGVPQ